MIRLAYLLTTVLTGGFAGYAVHLAGAGHAIAAGLATYLAALGLVCAGELAAAIRAGDRAERGWSL